MAQAYRFYKDVVFLDIVQGSNQLDMALIVLNGVSSEGKPLILGYALLAHESLHNYKWLLSQIKEMNQGVEPGVILTDYDPLLAQAIQDTLPKT